MRRESVESRKAGTLEAAPPGGASGNRQPVKAGTGNSVPVFRLLGMLIAGVGLLHAQAARGGGPAAAYPQRTPDAGAVARGKAVYDVNCAFCHGEDARGGDNGPNLIRGEVVMNDQNGETIGKVLATGRLAEGMPKFEFTAAQVSDVSAFLPSFRVGGYDASRNRPPSIVVGDAKAGEAYFKSKCSACHSATGDLKGIGARITDGRTLQQRWLMPTGGGRGGGQGTPTTV